MLTPGRDNPEEEEEEAEVEEEEENESDKVEAEVETEEGKNRICQESPVSTVEERGISRPPVQVQRNLEGKDVMRAKETVKDVEGRLQQ